jgi:curved DNA-binding protein CbpA
MPKIKRREYRIPASHDVAFYWEDSAGSVHTTRPRARDVSSSGMRVESSMPIECGTQVCVEVPRHNSAIDAVVRYCVADGAGFRIGVQFSKEQYQLAQSIGAALDYYEILQLSPLAEMETLHRVYRIMAARFHPDNPDSGDPERFLLLSEAYRILSDPAQRAEYDRLKGTESRRALPLFQERVFVDEREGEKNRRLGVLCLLYTQRRRNPEQPSIGLMDLEELMSIPREYLEFTLWYLKQKKYVEMGQGADFSLTAEGVDFIEEHTPARDLLMRLLAAGGSRANETESDPLTCSAVQ